MIYLVINQRIIKVFHSMNLVLGLDVVETNTQYTLSFVPP